MADIASYSPESVSVLVAGILTVDGFIEGSFVDVKKDAMPFRSVTMPDGTTARIYNKNSTYTITLRLHSASDSNDFLTKLWQIDEITQRGKFPFFVKDSSGSDLFFSTTTWIEGIPPIVKGVGIDERVWTLKSSQAVINVGGNGSASGILGDLFNIAASALPALEGLI